jgi:hypothetical protein
MEDASPVALIVALIAGGVAWNIRWEHRHRLRCGAREGILNRCSTPVKQPFLRCNRHTGMPRKRFP